MTSQAQIKKPVIHKAYLSSEAKYYRYETFTLRQEDTICLDTMCQVFGMGFVNNESIG